MRTKLLLGAATLAAGLASSMAQSNVYSVNVVGYYNVSVPAHGFNFVANQLQNGTNDALSVLGGSMQSDPNGVNNTTLQYWTGTGFAAYQYFTGADADNNFFTSGSVNGFYDTGGGLHNPTLGQGGAFFIQNPTANPLTVTLVGQVVQGAYSITNGNGFNATSFIMPVATNILSSLVNLPVTSDPNGVLNTTVYYWTGTGFATYQYFTGADADNNFFTSGSAAGLYDTGGGIHQVSPSVGAGFFIQNLGAAQTWSYGFTVQ